MKVFIDGSSLGNHVKQMNRKGGIGIFIDKNNINNVSETISDNNITNNRMELLACLKVLTLIKDNKIQCDSNDNICIYCDSEYTINCVTKWIHNWKKNNWKKSDNKSILNVDIIQQIDILLTNIKNIKFIHTNSHLQEPKNCSKEEYEIWYGNKMADELACLASNKVI